MSPKFRVEVKGDVAALRAVAPFLRTDDVRLDDDGDSLYVTSSTFEALMWPQDVIEAAWLMAPMIKAAMRLANITGNRSVHPYRVVVETSEGPQNYVYTYARDAPATGDAVDASVNGVPLQPAEGIPIELALSDPRIRLALELFARDPNWYDLYKVLDVVEEDLGGEKALEDKGWASKGELKRFTHTANSLGALGLDARHALDGFGVPKVPMPIQDAVQLIGRILAAWMATKHRPGPSTP